MIFSDNVALAQERALKEEARTLGKFVMGPDCGTALVNGVPLGFANKVRRGDVGVIGASGTGVQEVSTLISRNGGGVSHAIGTGGRDLHRDVGAITTLMAIDALDADPGTRRVVLISKPPDPEVARTVVDRIARSPKRFTVCFIGASDLELPANARLAPTLRAGAQDALDGRMAREAPPPAAAGRSGRVLGLYAGGTLAAEAQVILMRKGRTVASNAPVPGARVLAVAGVACAPGDADRVLDLGADEFTRGRPHPMIEPAVRDEVLKRALRDDGLGAVLIDVVIGTGAHADPAGHLASVLGDAPPGGPVIIASVTGTEEDPQVRSRQVATLERIGVVVAPSNAEAASWALALSGG
jgi:FdrA protein